MQHSEKKLWHILNVPCNGYDDVYMAVVFLVKGTIKHVNIWTIDQTK